MIPLPSRGSIPPNLDYQKVISLISVPFYILILAATFFMDGSATFAQPLLLLFLNSVFLGLVPLYVAYVSFVSFRRSGPVSILMMGAGMLFLGLGSIATGLIGLQPGSVNMSVTVFNSAACGWAFLQFAGALTALVGWREEQAERRSAVAATAYIEVIVVSIGLILVTQLGLTPTFFVPGFGSTLVRDLVLAGAIQFILLASGLFFVLYRKRDADFFFWYSLGMAMIALGLLAATFVIIYDDQFNWAARIGEYLGACSILFAFIVLQRRASTQSVSIQELLTTFFVQAEAGYRQLVETAADAIVVLDSAWRVLLWNSAAETLFGYTREEAVGMSFPALVLGDQELPALLRDVVDQPGAGAAPGAGQPLEIEVRRRGAGSIPVELTVSRRSVDGQMISTCIIRDLTERRQAEADVARLAHQVEAERNRFAAILDAIPDAIAIYDQDHRYVYVNPTLASNLHVIPAALIGRRWDELGLDPGESFKAMVLEVFASGEKRTGIFDYQADGLEHTYHAVVIPLHDETDDVTQVIVSFREITQIRKAEDALRRYSTELERSNKELQRFAYVASHDLQEPLRSIVSFSQLLEQRYRGRLDADADEYIGFLVEGGMRMQALIRDLLQFSRVEALAISPVPTDAGMVVGVAIRLLASLISQTDARVTVDPLPQVLVDPFQFEQVFVNLIGNAMKYRRPDVPPIIRVSATSQGDWWEFMVADNGIGIEPEYQDQIFEMFRRLHTKEEYDGTGIGLAIVRKIIERHGGQIRVESVPGQGSTFFFTMPAV